MNNMLPCDDSHLVVVRNHVCPIVFYSPQCMFQQLQNSWSNLTFVIISSFLARWWCVRLVEGRSAIKGLDLVLASSYKICEMSALKTLLYSRKTV